MLSTGSTFDRALKSGQKGATHRLTAPAGNLGIAFVKKLASNKGVMVQTLSPNSPLVGMVVPGWLLLDVGGVSIAPGDHDGAEKLLLNSEAAPRVLTFLDHEAESTLTAIVYEAMSSSWSSMAHVTVDAPPGKLGISFATFNSKPVVQTLAADSPLRGRVGLRWELLEVDGTNVSGLGHGPIAEMLKERATKEVRQLKFLAEEPQKSPPMFLAIVLVAIIAFCVHLVVSNRHEAELTGQMATPGFVDQVMEEARTKF